MNIKRIANSLSSKLPKEQLLLLAIELVRRADASKAVQISDMVRETISSKVAGDSPRPECLYCVLKHLSQATVLLQESLQGYPYHRWLAIGHLAEAETEMQGYNPAIARDIRAYRKKIEDGGMVDLIPLIEDIVRIVGDREFAAKALVKVAGEMI
jgi:hypothetical protein